jgi:hypothetical protein
MWRLSASLACSVPRSLRYLDLHAAGNCKVTRFYWSALIQLWGEAVGYRAVQHTLFNTNISTDPKIMSLAFHCNTEAGQCQKARVATWFATEQHQAFVAQFKTSGVD